MGLDRVRSEPRPKAFRFVRGELAQTVRPERVCWRCTQRGQTWAGDSPTCGFPDRKGFVGSNWNCATLNELRDQAEESKVYNEDQYAALLPIPDSGEFIVLSWHKQRGCTEAACVINGSSVRPLLLKDAERFLNETRDAAKEAANQHASLRAERP